MSLGRSLRHRAAVLGSRGAILAVLDATLEPLGAEKTLPSTSRKAFRVADGTGPLKKNHVLKVWHAVHPGDKPGRRIDWPSAQPATVRGFSVRGVLDACGGLLGCFSGGSWDASLLDVGYLSGTTWEASREPLGGRCGASWGSFRASWDIFLAS